MFLFWIFRTRNVTRFPCCLNHICGLRPLYVIFISLQLMLVVALFLQLRGIVDFGNVWNVHSLSPTKDRHVHTVPNFTSIFQLKDLNLSFFERHGSKLCYVDGTLSFKDGSCTCRLGWHGNECGIPSVIWFGKKFGQLWPRKKPRRIIHAFPTGASLDFLEIRLQELRKAVDVFIVAESNPPGHELKLPSVFNPENWLTEFISRLIYVPKFEDQPFEIFRTQIIHHLSDVRPDDIVLFSDADEVPASDLVTCMKLYDGFPQKVAFYYRQLQHGFYSIMEKNFSANETPSISASTIHFLLRACHGNDNCHNAYNRTKDVVVLGSPKYPAGWKCTKCNLNESFVPQTNESTTVYKFAPEYVLRHKHRFLYLLAPTVSSSTVISNSSTKHATRQTSS